MGQDGYTALHKAVIGRKEAVITHLLRKGASPHVKDRVTNPCFKNWLFHLNQKKFNFVELYIHDRTVPPLYILQCKLGP